jgi:hypothetical protein
MLIPVLRQALTLAAITFDSMKILVAFIFLLFATVLSGQTQLVKDNIVSKDSVIKFKLSFSTFNHAERIFNGTTTYLLTDSVIKVTKTFFGDTTSKTVYSRPISKSQNIISVINSIGLDSLKDIYLNNCVMLTSGDEYFLDFSSNSLTKNINLHHYYLRQLDDIIRIINSNLPKKYQFHYLSKDTKQDCSL